MGGDTALRLGFYQITGLLKADAEAVVAGVVNTQPAARARLAAFADKTAARVRPEG